MQLQPHAGNASRVPDSGSNESDTAVLLSALRLAALMVAPTIVMVLLLVIFFHMSTPPQRLRLKNWPSELWALCRACCSLPRRRARAPANMDTTIPPGLPSPVSVPTRAGSESYFEDIELGEPLTGNPRRSMGSKVMGRIKAFRLFRFGRDSGSSPPSRVSPNSVRATEPSAGPLEPSQGATHAAHDPPAPPTLIGGWAVPASDSLVAASLARMKLLRLPLGF